MLSYYSDQLKKGSLIFKVRLKIDPFGRNRSRNGVCCIVVCNDGIIWLGRCCSADGSGCCGKRRLCIYNGNNSKGNTVHMGARDWANSCPAPIPYEDRLMGLRWRLFMRSRNWEIRFNPRLDQFASKLKKFLIKFNYICYIIWYMIN